jgi:hypothetical protein
VNAAQLAALAAQARAHVGCADFIQAKNCGAIAEVLSVGRVRANTREIGNGTILETLGLAAGNALLDVINGNADFRHVKPLVEQGRLLIGSPLVQFTVMAMVSLNVLTQGQAEALCALGHDANPLTALEVAQALFNDDGTDKVWQ